MLHRELQLVKKDTLVIDTAAGRDSVPDFLYAENH